VFAEIAASAARLCDANDASIFQVDGNCLRLVAHNGPISAGPIGQFTLPLQIGDLRCSPAEDSTHRRYPTRQYTGFHGGQNPSYIGNLTCRAMVRGSAELKAGDEKGCWFADAPATPARPSNSREDSPFLHIGFAADSKALAIVFNSAWRGMNTGDKDDCGVMTIKKLLAAVAVASSTVVAAPTLGHSRGWHGYHGGGHGGYYRGYHGGGHGGYMAEGSNASLVSCR